LVFCNVIQAKLRSQ